MIIIIIKRTDSKFTSNLIRIFIFLYFVESRKLLLRNKYIKFIIE